MLEICQNVNRLKWADLNGRVITQLMVSISTSGNKMSRRAMETATREPTLLHLIYVSPIKL